MSDYAVGRFGFIMTFAFVCFAMAVLSLVVLIFHVGPRSILAKIAMILLSICGFGLFGAALFPTDLPGSPQTTSGLIHIIDAIINLISISIGSFLLTFSFKKETRWNPYFKYSLLLSSAIILAFLFWFFSPGSIFGLTNKILVISLCTWVVFTALYGRKFT